MLLDRPSASSQVAFTDHTPATSPNKGPAPEPTMQVQTFYDERTSTLTYVVHDAATGDAVVIDPVLDFDPASGRIWSESVERVATFLDAQGLTLRWILETHAHADHISGSQWLKKRYGAGVAIGSAIRTVQGVFRDVFDLGADFPIDGSQFDRLVDDGEVLQAGSLAIEAINTPGHTPACVSWKVEDAVFTGDAMFMPDMGTGRCDFPAGSADDLFDSISNRLFTLPDETRVFVGHDYQPGGRELAFETTIGAQKAGNIQLTAETSREQFVSFREQRDSGLAAPRLLLPSVQVNIDAGALPGERPNGRRYLQIPLRVEE
jgi:glyoxylase-like metal-dependent hydrolase (beta-lactamase superfamily II)